MSSTLRLTNLARVAVVSMAFALPFASVAYADEEYGTGHDSVIRQAAVSTPSAPLSVTQSQTLNEVFKVGQNDAFGGSRSSQLAPSAESYVGKIASTGLAGKRDVVGAGGAQDELATEIFHPGSGPEW